MGVGEEVPTGGAPSCPFDAATAYIKHILMRPHSKNKQANKHKADDFEIAHKTCSILVWVQRLLNRVC